MKISPEKHGRPKVSPGKLPWEPNHEAAENHEQEGDDAGVFDASQPFMSYTIERDPTMQVPYV
jgi:hypothetical protein